MCGLFGWLANQWDERLVMLAAILGVTMDERGGHSYGYWADGEIKKGLGTFSSGVVPAIALNNVLALMAHTRNATVGAKTIANAHPFEIGNIVGAHNGMVYNYYELDNKHKRDFDVDSMHLFANLNENKPLSEIDSYGAMTWIDKKDPDKICMCRWRGGLFAIIELLDTKNKPWATVWASELKFLTAAADVCGFRYTVYNVEEDHLYFVQNGHLRMDRNKKLGISTDIPKKNKVTMGGQYGQDWDYEGYWDQTTGQWHAWTHLKTEKKETKKSKKQDTIRSTFVTSMPKEEREKFEARGFKIEETAGGLNIIRLKPLIRDESLPDFSSTINTMRRKCFGCDETNVNCAKHTQLGTFLCYSCTAAYEKSSGATVEQIAQLENDFENDVNSDIPQDDEMDDKFRQFLKTGTTDNGRLSLPNGLELFIP